MRALAIGRSDCPRPAAVLCLAALAAAVGFRPACCGEDWPQWRGRDRTSRCLDLPAPRAWPAELVRAWRAEVGLGHSGPVALDGRVFAFSREGDDEVVRSLALDDGRELWGQRYAAPYKVNPVASSHGAGPKSTPAVTRDYLVTFGISGILTCWHPATGQRLWQKEFAGEFEQTSPLYGAAASPLLADGLCFVHVGGHGSGALRAIELNSGDVRWSWAEDGPAYASPILVEIDGVRQLVTQTQGHCVGIRPESGELLWEVPFTTAYVQNIVTPLAYGDLVLFSGTGRGTTAFRIARPDGQWRAEQAWHNDQVSMYMSSPVYESGRVFGLAQRDSGSFFCLDGPSGAVLWTSRGRQAENASLVACGDFLVALATTGKLHVLAADGDAYHQLAEYTVADSATWAHVAVVERSFLVKDEQGLTRWMLAAEERQHP